MIPDFLVVGHITKDIVANGFRAGGTAAYSALTASKLGLTAAVVTSAGPDLNIPQVFPERSKPIQVHVVPSEKTTTFENVYSPMGRKQFIHALAKPLKTSDVPKAWFGTPLVLLGPVAQEVDPDLARSFPRAIVGVTPQGWMRQWDEGGRVSPAPWKGMEKVIPHVQTVILSWKDAQKAKISIIASRVPVLAVTRGSKGATVHFAGRWRFVPAFPTVEADPTGAGDVYASAFLIRYAETKDPWFSALFASSAASFAVEGEGTSSIPSRAQVEIRLASFAATLKQEKSTG